MISRIPHACFEFAQKGLYFGVGHLRTRQLPDTLIELST